MPPHLSCGYRGFQGYGLSKRSKMSYPGKPSGSALKNVSTQRMGLRTPEFCCHISSLLMAPLCQVGRWDFGFEFWGQMLCGGVKYGHKFSGTLLFKRWILETSKMVEQELLKIRSSIKATRILVKIAKINISKNWKLTEGFQQPNELLF